MTILGIQECLFLSFISIYFPEIYFRNYEERNNKKVNKSSELLCKSQYSQASLFKILAYFDMFFTVKYIVL